MNDFAEPSQELRMRSAEFAAKSNEIPKDILLQMEHHRQELDLMQTDFSKLLGLSDRGWSSALHYSRLSSSVLLAYAYIFRQDIGELASNAAWRTEGDNLHQLAIQLSKLNTPVKQKLIDALEGEEDEEARRTRILLKAMLTESGENEEPV